jgi:hypothetical protein
MKKMERFLAKFLDLKKINLIILKTHKKNLYLLISLAILCFFSIIYPIIINSNREIIYEPDDHYHYLSKSNNFHNCKNEMCYEKNLFQYKTEKKLNRKEEYYVERQIQRLIPSYHPLYTLIIQKISNIKGSFDVQKKISIIISLLSALLIFLITKKIFKPQILILLSVIIGSHYYLVSGINYTVPYIFAALISLLSILTINNNKNYSLILCLISALIHKIFIIISAIIYFSYLFHSLNNNFNKKKVTEIIVKEKYYLLTIFIGLITVYKFEYTALKTELHFNSNFLLSEIPLLIKDSIFFFFLKSIKTIFLLNPILIYFFLKSFFIKLPDQIKILKITIFFIILISFFFINFGSVNDLMAKNWIIIVLTYLILSFYAMFNYEISKKEIFIKKLCLITFPLFILFNLYKNSQLYDLKIKKENYYYNYENINKYLSDLKLDNNEFIYFNSGEATFYYYLNIGFIKKNFLFKESFPNEKVLKKVKYIISKNPIVESNRNSDLILNNNTSINILTNNINKYKIIVFVNKKTSISINDEIYKLIKGYNEIELKIKELKFSKIKSPTRLSGLIIEDNQSTNWPWSQNFEFEYKSGNERYIKYNINYNFKRYYNFKDITYEIFKDFINCEKNILYDKDTSIITEVKCE